MGSIKGQEKTPLNSKRSHRPLHPAPVFSGFFKAWIVLAALVLGVPLLTVLLMHAPWVQEWAMQTVVQRVHQETGLHLTVGGFRWFPLGNLRLKDVSVESNKGPVFITESLTIRYNWRWSKPYLALGDVTLHRPYVRLEKGNDGQWHVPLPKLEDREKKGDRARWWARWPVPQVTVVSGRLQGFDGERCVLNVSEMTGTLRVRDGLEDGSLGVEVRLDPWRMEFLVPVRSQLTLTAQAFLKDQDLYVKTLQMTVNETSRIAVSGTWYDFPQGSFSAQVRLMPCSWAIKGWGGGKGAEALSGILEGLIDLEGTPARLDGRYDLRGSHGSFVGTARWAASKDRALLTADTSITGLVLPWDSKGASTVSGKTHLVIEHRKGGTTKISFALSQGRFSTEKMTMQDLILDVDFQEGIFVVRRASGRWDKGGYVEASGIIEGTPSTNAPARRPNLRLDVKADQVPLTLFQHLVPDHELAGVVSGQGKLQGAWPLLTWTGHMTGRDVGVDAFRSKAVRIDGTSDLSSLQAARKLTVELSSFAYGQYAGDFLLIRVHQQAEANTADVVAQGRRVAALDHLNLKGKLTSPEDSYKVFRMDKADFSFAGDKYAAQGELRVGARAVHVSSLRVIRGDEEMQLQGALRISGPLDVLVRLRHLDMAFWLSRFVPETSWKGGLKKWLQGRLDTQVRLKGTAEKPTVVLNGSLNQLSVPGLEQTFVPFSGRYEAGTLTLRVKLQAASLNTPVLLDGAWPLDLRFAPWTCRLRDGANGQLRSTARDVPLESLQAIIPLKELKGLASWDVRLVGSLKNPRLKGSGAVRGASFLWPGWTEKVQELEIRWRAEESSIHLESAEFVLLGSRGRAQGELLLPGGRFGGYALQVAGDDVRFPEIFGIEGQGSVRGTVTQKGYGFAPKIVGEVSLHKVSINLGELEKDVARQIRLVEETGQGSKVLLGTRRTQPRKMNGFENVAMQLKIHLPPKDAWVRGFGLEAEVHGAVTLDKLQGGSIQLHGTLWTSRGQYAFQGVHMRVEEGELTFRGETPPDPFLSVTCQKDLRDVIVTASLTGQLSRPRLVFSSFPEMDQVDIVSVLLYGRPAKELSARQARELRDRGVQFVWGGTTPVVKSLLGDLPLSPDAVDIKGSENGSVLEIGKHLTPELYVTYQKSLEGAEKDELRAEYRVNRFLSVESQVGGEDRAGVDVLFRYDFGR
ncbi:translocation/assembly module TamB domain-containing protein [Desulfosoma caldarium]|uniref:Uncharacterized protein DUF490 n=1 Tax=Desulfosoma caldarium TaxID=610254 RepID=A0A3N1VMP0_9BACT|nr:translocation/assembly module TamB [Desulfosoma caldarium]ROR01482.1 uncharacterized protein DUF490 [Desulfosoma caldarium]